MFAFCTVAFKKNSVRMFWIVCLGKVLEQIASLALYRNLVSYLSYSETLSNRTGVTRALHPWLLGQLLPEQYLAASLLVDDLEFGIHVYSEFHGWGLFSLPEFQNADVSYPFNNFSVHSKEQQFLKSC